MDRRYSNSHEKYPFEGELLEEIRSRRKFSFKNNLTASKALLARQNGRNGDNLYSLLSRLISHLLDNPSVHAVDHFEEYCRLAKMDFLSTVPCSYGPSKPDASAEEQLHLAKQMLDTLTQIETENIRFRPEFNHLIQQGFNTMGWDLPYGCDYFISMQIERTLRKDSDVKSCQFWGVMRSLGCDYYILEVEHREKRVDYGANWGDTGSNTEIASNIVCALVGGTFHKTTISSESEHTDGLQVESLECLKKLTKPLLIEILESLELVDPEIEEEHCRRDFDTLLTKLIEDLSSVSMETSEATDFVDPCESQAKPVPAESSASLLRIQLERMQVEERLNSHTFLVSEDPRTKPWHQLPHVTLEQLEATEGLRTFLVGNPEAPVRGGMTPFEGYEKHLLRALIARISAHRDGHVDGSETNLSLVKCISGTYGSVIGYDHELLQERVERWSEREEHGMKYWRSETWPGLCTFNDGEQFRCWYFGWGLEKLSHWYSPIVRIPRIREEYEVEVD